MTREEAIEYNKNLKMYMKLSDKNQPCKFLEENYIALDMAIKALEQEPKAGHWIGKDASGTNFYGKCSECGQEFQLAAWYTQNMNYCPNCGWRMVEP